MISLVTGGAGFIGSHVVDELIGMGHQVIMLDDLSGGFKRNISSRARFIKGSVTNKKLLDKIFRENKIDYIFHLAAYAAEGLSHFIRHFNYDNNLLASVNLIDLAVNYKVKRFVFTSSIAVYGSGQAPFSEKTIPAPEDPYGIAKYAVERDLIAASKYFGLKYTIFRPHNVYGERQNINDPFRNVIGIFMKQIRENKPLTVFGDGRQKRAFSYIADVAPYIACCLSNGKTANQIYNIGADTPYEVIKLAKIIINCMGGRQKIIHLPARNEVRFAFSNHAKVKNDFGIKKTVPLTVGINRMSAWVKNIRLTARIERFHLEITRDFPDGWKNSRKYVRNSI